MIVVRGHPSIFLLLLFIPQSQHVDMYPPWSLYISNHFCTMLELWQPSTPLVMIKIEWLAGLR
jgi:hypothetical protein